MTVDELVEECEAEERAETEALLAMPERITAERRHRELMLAIFWATAPDEYDLGDAWGQVEDVREFNQRNYPELYPRKTER